MISVPTWIGSVASYLLQGAWVTVILCFASVSASLAIGLVLGSLSVFSNRVVRILVRAYVEVWRGLPAILILFFVFFALPTLNIHLNAMAATIVGLALWGSANIAEIVRGAVQSIPASQHDAARAIGLSTFQLSVFVVVPQAARRMLPPLVSFIAHAIQNTTLAAAIGTLDILEAGNRSVQRLTFDLGDPHAVPIFTAVLIFFFVICFPLTRLAAGMEKRLVV